MTPTEAASTLRALGWRCEPPEVVGAATLAPPATEAPTEPVEGQTWVTATGTELRVLRVCDQYVTLDAGGRQIPRAEWAVWVRLFGARLTAAPQTAPALQPAPTLAPESEAPVEPSQAPRVGEVWWSYKIRSASRRVVGFEQRWGKGCVVYVSGAGSDTTHLPLASWHAWVRKSGSRRVWPPAPAPQPTPVLAALAPADGADAPRVGEVWEAARRMDRRRVVLIDANSDDELCVGYAIECDDLIRPLRLSLWHAWVRRSGAKVVA